MNMMPEQRDIRCKVFNQGRGVNLIPSGISFQRTGIGVTEKVGGFSSQDDALNEALTQSLVAKPEGSDTERDRTPKLTPTTKTTPQPRANAVPAKAGRAPGGSMIHAAK